MLVTPLPQKNASVVEDDPGERLFGVSRGISSFDDSSRQAKELVVFLGGVRRHSYSQDISCSRAKCHLCPSNPPFPLRGDEPRVIDPDGVVHTSSAGVRGSQYIVHLYNFPVNFMYTT